MLQKHHQDILDYRRPELVKEIDPDSLFPELRKRKLVTIKPTRGQYQGEFKQNYRGYCLLTEFSYCFWLN